MAISLLAGCTFFFASAPAATPFPTARNSLPQTTAAPLSGGEQTASFAWGPELLYGIISSADPAALDALNDAAFAAGPSIVPQLEAALQDDRTAEFAAQSLAFIGGEDAVTALSKLVSDPRNLDLRRFFYGALGEIDTPQANAVLLNVIRNANNEPDRTVTEAAIIALTVGNRVALVPELKQAQAKLTDPVIQDDLANAISIIEARAKYLAVHKTTGGSLQQALNLYFEPALEANASSSRAVAPHRPSRNGAGAAPAAKVETRHVEFSPDQNRALARVIFNDMGSEARYHIVLQKRYGDWTVASVWLSLGNLEITPAGSPIQNHPSAPSK